MKERIVPGFLFSEGGIHCPLCGNRMPRGSLFCGHCRRAGRVRVDASKVRAASKGVYLPRAMARPTPHRHNLKRSA